MPRTIHFTIYFSQTAELVAFALIPTQSIMSTSITTADFALFARSALQWGFEVLLVFSLTLIIQL